MWLVIRLRFPMGSYDAGGAGLRPEWPPSPERICAAAIAGGAGTAADQLYTLEPPLISAPKVGRARNGRYSRWVPRQAADFRAASKYGGKVDKSPGDNVGVMVDPKAVLSYAWQVDPDTVDLDQLNYGLSRVAYLGRPTSAALLSAELVNGFKPDPDHDLYQPDPRGKVKISVPSLQVRLQRERIWTLRQAAGAMDVRTPAVVRTWARYTARVPDQGRRDADRAQVGRRTAGWLWFHAPRGTSGRALPQLVAGLQAQGAVDVLPACTDGQVVCIGVRGMAEDTETVSALVGSQIVTLTKQGARPPAVVRAISPLVSVGSVWTTTMPITMIDSDQLRDAVQAISPDAQLVDAMVHDAPKSAGDLWARPEPGSTHVTVWFRDPIVGPLFLGDTALQAVTMVDDEEGAA